MDPALNSGVKLAANWVNSSRWKPSNATKDGTSASKILASVFWDVQGILFIVLLENGRTINSEYYIALLVRLKEEIAKDLPQMNKKKCSFTVSQFDRKNGKTIWISLRTVFSTTDDPILQIWPPVTTCCLQTSKECFR